jgi:voltage-gated potassium channel
LIFLREGSAAIFLVTLTLSLQCAGMAAVISWARPSFAPGVLKLGPIRSALLMMRLMTAFIVLHVLEILLWAAFYRWLCFPLWESAFYFSTSSYATVGYGDIVLPQMWRTLGPVESVIGVLMCGLSASFLFAIVSRLIDASRGPQALPSHTREARYFANSQRVATQPMIRRGSDHKNR